MGTETIRFQSPGGPSLEGRLAVPGEARGAAVLCHPHPQHGGSMSSGMIPNLQRAFTERGWASLRFNYRGVGRSEGTYGDGIGELEDARTALDRLAEAAPGAPLAIAGWSFGSIVALNAAAADPRIVAYAGIAPPTTIRTPMALPFQPEPDPLEGWKARALIACGTEDPFCTPAAVQRWAEAIPGAQVRIFEGADHFFTDRRDEVAVAVADFVTG